MGTDVTVTLRVDVKQLIYSHVVVIYLGWSYRKDNDVSNNFEVKTTAFSQSTVDRRRG